ncbi:hypothetical protein CCR75_004992 [Bremia lactucae]|uniref:Uncharacterized protein n=1 Tax=Bremia lactucae TaxID=4779 RepID=A0A976IGC2_BRELC|nr:hypothetical protein CCR75_004992 [Bremia lactucae]
MRLFISQLRASRLKHNFDLLPVFYAANEPKSFLSWDRQCNLSTSASDSATPKSSLFSSTWFSSPFDTQVKLSGAILPKYLQILQKGSNRERGHIDDVESPHIGKYMTSCAVSSSGFSCSLGPKDQINVSFFCRFYTFPKLPIKLHIRNINCASAHMNA